MINPIKNRVAISESEFNNTLKSRFGLSIDKDSICKYVDNFSQNQKMYNINNPKVFTISYKDKKGFPYSNINGVYYKNHAIKKSDLHKDFNEFINTYTFKIGNYFMF
ncbi:hypothetical protein [Flavobacterium sp.]|uniref:hypothetical protein n=1 Tax=Flavobacterium sp. TaxID=239 RepID=UPI0025F9B80F|nr:hypothetical protein [Flavobacterium sp.]